MIMTMGSNNARRANKILEKNKHISHESTTTTRTTRTTTTKNIVQKRNACTTSNIPSMSRSFMLSKSGN